MYKTSRIIILRATTPCRIKNCIICKQDFTLKFLLDRYSGIVTLFDMYKFVFNFNFNFSENYTRTNSHWMIILLFTYNIIQEVLNMIR